MPEGKKHDVHAAPLLDRDAFVTLVAHAPLISIDLIVQDQRGSVLLGLRNNPPARGAWFVPGGRIRKNETLDAAFSRIAAEEIGQTLIRSKAQLLDVYEHFYSDNFAEVAGVGTHYVVLAYRVPINREAVRPPNEQHSRYRWMQAAEALDDPDVHPYSKAYFSN